MKLSKRGLNTKGSSTLKITAMAKELISNGVDVVAFTAGEPDFNTPTPIKNAGIEAITNNFTTYTPPSGSLLLKEAIVEKLKRDNNLTYDTSEIVVSNGAKHSLMNTFFALIDDFDEVLIPVPYWLSYKSMVELSGGVPVFIETKKENDYKATIEELENALTDKTKILLINSPSNPTGVVLSENELQAYADFAIKHDLVVISDEIYEKLIYDDNTPHISIASLENMKDRTVVVNGLSKSHAMTGWRMGYVACNKELASAINNIQSHMTSNPCTITQHASITALKNEKDLATMNKAFKERRDYIFKNVSEIDGLTCIYPNGAFYLYVDISELIGKTYNSFSISNCTDIASLLIEHFRVCVVPCTDFGSNNHIRLSYAISLSRIEEGVNRIKAFVESLE